MPGTSVQMPGSGATIVMGVSPLDSSGGFGDAQRSGRVVEDHQHAGVLEMRSDHGLRIGGVADDDRDVELVEFGGEVMILNDGDDGRACLVKARWRAAAAGGSCP